MALREPQGERNKVPPGSPFGRVRAGPSRASGRTEHGSPRFTLRQGQGRPFESLRANGTRFPPVHPSAGSGRALREAQGERNTVPPGSPFGRLRPGPSRGSGRAERGSPRFTLRQAQGRPFERLRASGTRLSPVHPSAGSGQALRFPSGRTERGSPRFTLRQGQGGPFERLRANGTRFPPVHPSAGSGQALREAQVRPFERLRAGPSRASGRTEHGSRFTLRFPSGRTERGSPRFTFRQGQGRPFESLRANGTRFPPVHLSAGSGQALREPQGERNTVPPGSPFGRLRAGPSRASGRTEHGSRFTLRFPSGRTERGSPRFTFRQGQGRPFESLRANGTRFPPVHLSAGSGQALREPQGERNTVPPGSPFGRLRAGPSRASGRTEHGSRFTLRFPSGRTERGSPRFTFRQGQGRPFESLRANGTRLPVHPSAGSGQALLEPQGERNTVPPGFTLRQGQGGPFERLRANGEPMWRRRDGLRVRD